MTSIPQITACGIDDCEVLCWELDDDEWISEADYDYTLKHHPEYIAVIESHQEFAGWKTKCLDCLSSEEHCVCAEEEDSDEESDSDDTESGSDEESEEHCGCEDAEYNNNDDDDVAKYGGCVITEENEPAVKTAFKNAEVAYRKAFEALSNAWFRVSPEREKE